MEPLDLSSLNLPEKEQRILEAAIAVFSEKGFSAATTSEIAKNAGVAEGTIFRYFKTKKDILRGILIQTISLMSGKLVMDSVERILRTADEQDLPTVLKQLLYDRMKLVDNIFPMARVIITEALFHEDVRQAIYENIISKALDIFKVFHQRMVEKGIIRDDIDPEVFLRTIMGNLAALIMQRKLFGDKFEINDLDSEIDKMIDIMLHGMAKS